jgi:hypothetical protein
VTQQNSAFLSLIEKSQKIENMKTLAFLSMLVLLLITAIHAQSQFLTVTGTVKDQQSGETLRQLSIMEKISGIGTITSGDGSFLLALKGGKVELAFSDPKHEAITIGFELHNDTTIQVILKPLEPLERKPVKKQGLFSDRSKPVALSERIK